MKRGFIVLLASLFLLIAQPVYADAAADAAAAIACAALVTAESTACADPTSAGCLTATAARAVTCKTAGGYNYAGSVNAPGSPYDKLKSNLGTPRNLIDIVTGIIQLILGFLGLILVAFIMYAGFLWFTDQGDEAQVKKARTILKNSIIGLILIVAAFAITQFVVGAATGVVNPGITN